MDRHALYECCVQRPDVTVRLLADQHGGQPLSLAEDFCGTAAICREWVRSHPARTATAIDADPAVLGIARERLASVDGATDRVRLINASLGDAGEVRAFERPFDVVYAGNFSIGELRDRPSLMRYLRSARKRLTEGGILACDTYGGRNAFAAGMLVRTIVADRAPGEPERVIRYAYEQVVADPISGMVENHLHFELIENGERSASLRSAFIYRWRLWSVPELRDAMLEAGFAKTQVTWSAAPTAADTSTSPPDSYAALVVGRV